METRPFIKSPERKTYRLVKIDKERVTVRHQSVKPDAALELCDSLDDGRIITPAGDIVSCEGEDFPCFVREPHRLIVIF